MNFHHMRIFLTVCEVDSMTRAANERYMAQSPVSQAIAALEKYYDVRLLERLNHKLYLTAAGQWLPSYAHHIMNLSTQARKELANLNRVDLSELGPACLLALICCPI